MGYPKSRHVGLARDRGRYVSPELIPLAYSARPMRDVHKQVHPVDRFELPIGPSCRGDNATR